MAGDNDVMGFKLNKSEASKVDLKVPDEGDENSSVAPDTTVEEDLEEECTIESSVTIALVRNFSLYRKANDRVLDKKIDYIGSSVNSSRVLSSNKKEIEIYFPSLIGVAANNDRFITRVKQYLNNIRVQVDTEGLKLDTSFHYYHKKDYIRIAKELEKVETIYERVDKRNELQLKRALKEKITKINAIESSKCDLGYPVSLEDYLLYRHCLLYNDICKEIALLNTSTPYRFYFKDDTKEKERENKLRLERNKAKANYISCIADDELFDAVYIKYCTTVGLPINTYIIYDRAERENRLDKFSTDEPIKFNRFFVNKDLKLEATIERLIARGELIRTPNTQNISTSDGQFIGANMNEAISWFKLPENSSAVNVYINKLKNI